MPRLSAKGNGSQGRVILLRRSASHCATHYHPETPWFVRYFPATASSCLYCPGHGQGSPRPSLLQSSSFPSPISRASFPFSPLMPLHRFLLFLNFSSSSALSILSPQALILFLLLLLFPPHPLIESSRQLTTPHTRHACPSATLLTKTSGRFRFAGPCLGRTRPLRAQLWVTAGHPRGQ